MNSGKYFDVIFVSATQNEKISLFKKIETIPGLKSTFFKKASFLH